MGVAEVRDGVGHGWGYAQLVPVPDVVNVAQEELDRPPSGTTVNLSIR
jgi:hypothetical protein